MKRLILGAIAICLMPVTSAGAGHAPSAYCSESGDVCVSAKGPQGSPVLKIVTAAKYFDRYKLCVTAPEGTRTCRTFAIEKLGRGVFGSKVPWRGNFPDKGAGAYVVKWKSGGQVLARRLGFHIAS